MVNTKLSGPAGSAGGTWYEISALPWWDRGYTLLCLAWDEGGSSSQVDGSDYSMLAWSTEPGREGYGFYGDSVLGRKNNNSGPFFNPTVYGYNGGINLWILPPGVPDF